VQVKPDGEDAETDRPTVPVKPLRAVAMIVDVPWEPAEIWSGDKAPADMEKSEGARTMREMATE